jgi:hypothetical protein
MIEQQLQQRGRADQDTRLCGAKQCISRRRRHCVTIQAADGSALHGLSSCLARHLSMDFRNFSEILI